jgi:L-lactate dehydrogenase complex protein LldE
VIAAFEPFDYVVVPSGSCGGMIKEHYPRLLADDPAMRARAGTTLALSTVAKTAFSSVTAFGATTKVSWANAR